MTPQDLALEALKLAQQAEESGNPQPPASDLVVLRARTYLAFLTTTEAQVQLLSQAQQTVVEATAVFATTRAQAAIDALKPATPTVPTPPTPSPPGVVGP